VEVVDPAVPVFMVDVVVASAVRVSVIVCAVIVATVKLALDPVAAVVAENSALVLVGNKFEVVMDPGR
jgi:hypothetical protein